MSIRKQYLADFRGYFKIFVFILYVDFAFTLTSVLRSSLNYRIGHLYESAPLMHFIRQRMKSCDEWDKGLVGHNCECLSNSLILSPYKTMQIWLSKQICTKTNMLGKKDAALSSDCFILVPQRHMIQPLHKTKITVKSFPLSENWNIQNKVYIVLFISNKDCELYSIGNIRIMLLNYVNILKTVLFENAIVVWAQNSCIFH